MELNPTHSQVIAAIVCPHADFLLRSSHICGHRAPAARAVLSATFRLHDERFWHDETPLVSTCNGCIKGSAWTRRED